MASFNHIVDFNNNIVGQLDIHKRKIHIRFQISGSRSITIIEGLDDDLDLIRISKNMKKSFSCAATVLKDTEENEIIQLQGDQRDNVKKWLLKQEVITEAEAKERIVIHGI
jgi:translation initiation factor 1